MANNNRNQYNQDWDQSRRRFDRENEYGQNYGNDQNRNRQSDYGSSNYGDASYGSQYNQQNDWSQDMNENRGGNYGSGGGWNRNRDWEDRPFGNTGNYGGSYSNRNTDRNWNNRNSGNRDWWERTKDEVSSWFRDEDSDRRREGDRRTMGVHKGKGPKGYTRSDDRIREDVHDRLSDDPHVDASDIEIKVENSEVVLTGNVSDREQKRRAEDVVESVSGVRHVENRIRVNQEQHSYAASNQASNQRRGNYTGTTGDVGGIGSESGTTNEIIRNTGNSSTNR